MPLDRRQLLAGGGAWLAAYGARLAPGEPRADRLDALLQAHADCLPERAGAGASHYPMAAEALEALGRADAIDDAWIRGAAGYAGALPRTGAITVPDEALGDHGRFGDWLDLFVAELARAPWREVVAEWTPRLAPGCSAALFHGLIRTAHAARALRTKETPARRHELAHGLAYWAARSSELPTRAADPGSRDDLRAQLTGLDHPWLEDDADVSFEDVMARLTTQPLAPPVEIAERGAAPADELSLLVREAALAFLEMLVLERHRIWLLHTVTGPAAAALLLPELDEAGARILVAHARQAVVAMYAAYGEPYEPGAHLRADPGTWPDLTARAVETRSVHTIKLTEALRRCDPGDDALHRSIAAQWLEWK